MPPIRRYLRITKYTVLEVRVYLDNPALAQSWLLNARDPVLPKVIASVRPLVLPKLREERDRERNRKKNSKKRSIKDVIIEDGFEVSIFLTETPTRHSLLHKQKLFRDKTQTKLKSNSSKLTGGSHDTPIDLDSGELLPGLSSEGVGNGGVEPAEGELAAGGPLPSGLRLEEDVDDAVLIFDDIPTAPETEALPTNRREKRRRGNQEPGRGNSDGDRGDIEAADSDAPSDELFVGDGDSDGDLSMGPPPSKRHKDTDIESIDQGQNDDKKKLAMDISYEGFAIYGRVLCLVVKRRDGGGTGRGGAGAAAVPSGRPSASTQQRQPGGQASMEAWITSTQVMQAAADEPPA